MVSDHQSNPQQHHQKKSSQNLQGILPFTRVPWQKIGLAVLSLVLFFTALELMKAGARHMTSLTRSLASLDNPLDGLGLGWLSSYLALSGSPVAAISLTLFDIQAISHATTFLMIVGSRVGGSLVVIFIGLLYFLQGHARKTSLLTGILSFLVTSMIYIPAVPLGLFLLRHMNLNLIAFRNLDAPANSLGNQIFDPVVSGLLRVFPRWVIFLLGVGLTILSLKLIDQALPKFELKGNVFGEVPRLLYRPSISFLLGFGFTLLTMSVSISLGLLVPLSVRGYIKRENLLPYIMGSNISTFIDTIIAGLLLRNPAATNLVLVQIISVLIVSLLILAAFYRRFQRFTLGAAFWLNDSKIRLIGFLLILVIVPIGLIFG